MNNEKAKLVLSVYRPGGQDAIDPTFDKALDQVRRDPAMAVWFEEQRRLDEQMMDALAGFPVPSDGRLIAGLAIEPRRWRFAFRPLALAASVILMLSLGVWALLGDRTLQLPETATLTQISLYLTEHQSSLGLMSDDLARVRSWLESREGPVPGKLPPGLAQLTLIGCETWKTTRGRVSLICFMGEGQQVAHLYIFEGAQSRGDLPSMNAPSFSRENDWLLASWQDGRSAYVLGAPAAAGTVIESYLKS